MDRPRLPTSTTCECSPLVGCWPSALDVGCLHALQLLPHPSEPRGLPRDGGWRFRPPLERPGVCFFALCLTARRRTSATSVTDIDSCAPASSTTNRRARSTEVPLANVPLPARRAGVTPFVKRRAPCAIRCFMLAVFVMATGKPNSFPAARMASIAFATASRSPPCVLSMSPPVSEPAKSTAPTFFALSRRAISRTLATPRGLSMRIHGSKLPFGGSSRQMSAPSM